MAAACAIGVVSWAWQAAASSGTEELDTPFVVTPDNVVKAMLDLAQVRPRDRLIDLGSGDGRIVIAAAQRGATATGIEIDANLVERSRERAHAANVGDRTAFVTQDLFETDFAGYDVVTMYLLPDVNRRLAPKLLTTLKPGARIVSHDYGLGDWPPDRTIVVEAPDKPVGARKASTIHFWRVPAQLAGEWAPDAGSAAVQLDFTQHYQQVSGTLRYAGREYRLVDPTLSGTTLTAVAQPADGPSFDLLLQADGDRLVGAMNERGRTKPIRLTLRQVAKTQ
ncbi:MAG TPA: class I SAM-dependent methyltransferase [Casimicrobiaceae bacterium]|nr:class I SAM-dependent methyltransferase [Casimicrobiaceae bacterium]